MSKEQHDAYDVLIAEEGRRKFEAMAIGEIQELPVGCVKPTQPNDRKPARSKGPIEVDTNGFVINGNHRWWQKRTAGPRTKIFMKKVPNAYSL